MKKVTVAFESGVLLFLRAKAAATGRSISALVNEAVALSLREDAEDDAVFATRGQEPNWDFDRLSRHLDGLGVTDTEIESDFAAFRAARQRAPGESLALVPDSYPLSEAERSELDQRLEDYRRDPGAVSPWPEVKARIRARD